MAAVCGGFAALVGWLQVKVDLVGGNVAALHGFLCGSVSVTDWSDACVLEKDRVGCVLENNRVA